MAYTATHRFARISARKVRPLADLIRGKFADEALDILQLSAAARCADAGEGAEERPGQCRRSPGAERRRPGGRSTPASTAARCSSGFARVPAAWRSWSSGGCRTSHVASSVDANSSSVRPAVSFTIAANAARPRQIDDPWVKKSIRSAFAPASWSAGRAAGMPRRRSSPSLLIEDFKIRKFIKDQVPSSPASRRSRSSGRATK